MQGRSYVTDADFSTQTLPPLSNRRSLLHNLLRLGDAAIRDTPRSMAWSRKKVAAPDFPFGGPENGNGVTRNSER